MFCGISGSSIIRFSYCSYHVGRDKYLMNSPIVLLNQNSQVGTNTVVEIDNRFHTFAAYITTSSDWVNGTFTATMEISDNANFTGNWINFGGPIYNLAANSIYSLSFGGVFI